VFTLISCATRCVTPARAEDSRTALPPAVAASKPGMSARDSAAKREGTYVTGLPVVDSDPDTGFGIGAVANVFWDGPRADPLFDRAPYRHRLLLQGFVTTHGFQQHLVDYDAPYLRGTSYRLRATIIYERNTSANYYGRGAATLAPLSFPGAGRTFSTMSSYTAALRTLQPGNVSHTLYNKYDLEDPSFRASVERDLFGGLIRVQVGIGVSYARVRDYSGTPTVGDDVVTGQTDLPATMATTRLEEDCDAGRVVGCAGGMHDTLKLGIAFDTRDYEPNPKSGVFVDLAGEFSNRVIGSAYDYARVTFTPRVFVSPMPALADLVLALRGVVSMQTSGVPFFAMSTLAFTDIDRQGLGGIWTLRGYNQDRFVGPIAAAANGELRWAFVTFDILRQNFSLAAVPFFDVGRVYDRVRDLSFRDWRYGAGGGLHVAWNKATVVVFDYGLSVEGRNFYMGIGQQF